MSKMLPEIGVQIARNTALEVWDMSELLEVIRQEVEAQEVSDGVKTNVNLDKPKQPQFKLPPTANALVSMQEKEFQLHCVYCNGEHYSASCTKVQISKDRKEILQKNNRCFICLKTGHGVINCFKTKKCRHCDGKHHQSICPKIDTPTEEQRNTNQNENSNESQNESTTVTKTTTANSLTKGTVLLQTASCMAVNGSNSIPVRVLFDNGSQRSYVSSSVSSRLNLKPVSSENMRINTFGNANYQKQKCNVVKLCLQTRSHKELELVALNYPVICSPLPNKINVADFVHLEGLDFADNFDSTESIDVLIGSNYYWDFVTGDSIKGEHGPTAVDSKFGWLLSGPTYD